MRERGVGDRLHVLDPLARALLGREEACVVDRDRRSIRGELQQLGLGRREHPRRQRPHVEHAEHLSRHEQRDAEHRLDPFPAQDRVEHVRVADVVDDHGLLQGGDATGEPAPDRDAHAGLDLLLDPDGRGRDELVRVLVEQQHRAGVDLE